MGKPLRILFVAHRYLPGMGGTELHTHEVARRLAATGHGAVVLTTDRTGDLRRREELDGVKVIRVSAWPKESDLYWAPAIHRVIRKANVDIVHCQGYHTLVAPVAMYSAIRAGIPYVMTFHSGYSSPLRWMIRRAQWRLLRSLLMRAETLIAVSKFEARLFQRALHLPQTSFTVIPNGANIHVDPAALSVEEDPDLIVSIGRLERYKGHHRVLAALPYVLRDRPRARVVFLGSGPYEGELRRLAARLGCIDRIEIRSTDLTEREATARLLKSAALVTVLSEYEAQGIAAFEAAFLGRPLLVAESSALEELVHAGIARGVSLDEEPRGVARAILDQLTTPLIPRYVALPTWEDCTTALTALYRSIVTKNQARTK